MERIIKLFENKCKSSIHLRVSADVDKIGSIVMNVINHPKFFMEVLLMQNTFLVGFDKCVGKLYFHDSKPAKS